MPGETWSFTQQGAGAGGGEVSPGSGSSGFTPGQVVFANSSGQLVNPDTAFYWDTTNKRLGLGTTAPTGSLDIASTLGIVLSTGSGAGVGGINFRNGPQIAATSTSVLRFTLGGLLRLNLNSSGIDILSTVNGNVLSVFGTTGATTAAGVTFNVKTTGSTSKVGFWTTGGSTQASSYTTSPGSGKVMPATNVAAGIAEINQLIGVVNAIIGDFKAYGLFKT